MPSVVNIHIGIDANRIAIKKLNTNILLTRNDTTKAINPKRNAPFKAIETSSLSLNGKLLSSINFLLQSVSSFSDKRKKVVSGILFVL